MNDIQRKALERARQRKQQDTAPNGTTGGQAFASERQRAKEALRNELSTFTGQNIHKIEATVSATSPNRKLVVAAYCRVSTDDIDQVQSIELQRSNYKQAILENPNWKYYGTFVDDGFSGTNTEHRPAFQMMMKHAEEGRFDMIITKSVSRFARNLVDCITWVRALQDHDPPIAVYFEQEGINTLSSTSNVILFVLAMVAEEESHMKSEAMLLSLEWRFSRGRFLVPKLLGYDKIVEQIGNNDYRKYLQINEDEARTVRLAYFMVVNGYSLTEIAETLTDLQRFTGGRKKGSSIPNTEWTANAVRCLLRNERYAGDVLARKTWTPDFHTHKAKKNRGDKNKYYQANHHEAIIPRAIWNAAQRILNSNRYGHSGTYKPMRVIDHGILCGFISMNRSWAGFPVEEYERVSSIAMQLKEGVLEADLGSEELPDGGFPLHALSGEEGVLRISRHLTEEERRFQLIRGEAAEEQEPPKVRPGFQVVDSGMFSHHLDPVLRFTRNSILFSSTCVSKFNRLTIVDGEPEYERVQYVEFLFNPIKHIVAVRPCDPDHPNAIRWVNDRGCSVGLGATALCKTIYTSMNWEEKYTFRIPARTLTQNGSSILLFNLDNFVGYEQNSKKPTPLEPEDGKESEIQEWNMGNVEGIFYGPDDEPQSTAEIEIIESRLAQYVEQERLKFGTHLQEHEELRKLSRLDPDLDLMAEARRLDIDHTVDNETVEALQEELLNELLQSEGYLGAEAEPDDEETATVDTVVSNDGISVSSADPNDGHGKTMP